MISEDPESNHSLSISLAVVGGVVLGFVDVVIYFTFWNDPRSMLRGLSNDPFAVVWFGMVAPHIHLAFLLWRKSQWSIQYSVFITMTMGALAWLSFLNRVIWIFSVGALAVFVIACLNSIIIYRGHKE